MTDPASLREVVREKYGDAAKRAIEGTRSGCCGTGPACGCADPITSDLYTDTETASLPAEAVAMWLVQATKTFSIACGQSLRKILAKVS